MTDGRTSLVQRYLLALVILSGLWILLCVCLQVGLDHTPWDTTDSHGRPMGFNDRLSHEHYRIALRHVGLAFQYGEQRPRYGYDLLLLVMAALGVWLLASSRQNRRRRTRWFFLLQSLLFPLGWLMLPLAPEYCLDLFTERLDREAFIDLPFDWITTQPLWVVVSLTVALVSPGEPLAIKDTWRCLCQRFAWQR